MDTNPTNEHEVPVATNGYEAIVDNIIAAMNVFYEDDHGVYMQLREDLVSQLEDCVNGAIVRAIPDEEQEEFGRVLELDSEEELSKFYKRVVPDFESLVTGEMIAFKKRFIP